MQRQNISGICDNFDGKTEHEFICE